MGGHQSSLGRQWRTPGRTPSPGRLWGRPRWVPCLLALVLVATGCASSSTSGGGSSEGASQVPTDSSAAPGEVMLAPASAAPITVVPADVPVSAGVVTDMAWTAAASSAPTPEGFVVLTGKVSTTADCGTPELTTVSVIDAQGKVLTELEFELTALLGSGVSDGVLVMGIRQYGEAGSDFSSRKDGYLRIDLATGKVLGLTETTSRTEGQYAGAGEESGLWVGIGPSELGLMDPRTGKMIRTIPTPEPMTRVLATDSTLWVVNDLKSPLQPYWQLDPADGTVLNSLEWSEETEANHPAAANPKPFSVAVGDGLVLVDNDKVVQRVDADGTVTGVRLEGLGEGLPGLPRASNGAVWVGFESGEVVELDGATLELLGAGRVSGLELGADIASDGATVAILQGGPDEPRLALLPTTAFGP